MKIEIGNVVLPVHDEMDHEGSEDDDPSSRTVDDDWFVLSTHSQACQQTKLANGCVTVLLYRMHKEQKDQSPFVSRIASYHSDEVLIHVR